MRRDLMRRQLLAATTLYNTPADSPTPSAPPVGGPPPTPADLAARTVPPVTPSGDPAGPGEQTVTYTQRHLNLIMAKEKKQGGQAALRTLAEVAGLDPTTVTDEQLKTFLTDAKATRDAALTEEQRRAADLDAREQALAAKEAQAVATASAAQAELRSARQQAVLLQLGVPAADVEVAQAFLARGLADDADDAAIRTAAEQLKSVRPVLFTGTPAAPAAPPAPGGAPAGSPAHRTGPAARPGDRGRARAEAMGLA
ncbi:hypothetical protein [Kitasatospora sp. NPDC058478]|uniref:hypothetical protein n=1 Tax=unclassified Kitasatospora TaxID=2633591 RepID=UPI00364A7657